jgi:Zn-dependent protease/predicted transcriptional regulator
MDDQPTENQKGGPPRTPGTIGTVELFGIPVRFHFTFWLIVVWLIVIGSRGQQSAAGTTAYILAIFGSVLLHELGHALTARRFGIGTKEIMMLPIGGLARLERQPGAREEFWVALAGPAVNLVIGGALFAYVWASGAPVTPEKWVTAPSDANLAERIGVANLILAGFNLLPAFPMDGGRILRSLLARWRPEHEATRTAARVGMGLAGIMGLYGLLAGNFFLVFVAFFVYVGAMQERVASDQKVLIGEAVVRPAMVTEFRTLNHGDTLRDAAELLLATAQQDFPVMAGPAVAGLLTRQAMLKAMAAEGPEAYVAGAMDRDFIRVTPSSNLGEAVQQIAASPGSCALVFEDERLVGMLTAENVSEFLVLREIGQARERSGEQER